MRSDAREWVCCTGTVHDPRRMDPDNNDTYGKNGLDDAGDGDGADSSVDTRHRNHRSNYSRRMVGERRVGGEVKNTFRKNMCRYLMKEYGEGIMR